MFWWRHFRTHDGKIIDEFQKFVTINHIMKIDTIFGEYLVYTSYWKMIYS